MSQDRSNFFELPKQEREELCKEGDITINKDGEKLKKYLEDFPPSAIEFLKNIVNDVKTKDTPYVMSIEGGFGTGKTHFMTRMCQYMRDKEIDAVYFNAFEYDDIDPKMAVLNEIYKYAEKIPEENKNSIVEKIKGVFDKLKSYVTTESVNVNVGLVNASFKLTLKSEMDKIKDNLRELIDSGKDKRLVLIIDELDRCNPKFCVSLLETIKHFFNMDGLFIILSINYKAFLESIKGVYGSDFASADGRENYLTKFIDYRNHIYGFSENDYKKIIQYFFGDFSQDNKNQIETVSHVFNQNRLTVRQTKKCVDQIKEIIIKLGKNQTKGMGTLLYSCIVCRYESDFKKIENIRNINIEKKQQLYNERIIKFIALKSNIAFARASILADRRPNDNPGVVNLWKQFIIAYPVVDFSDFESLHENIHMIYKIICKQEGEADKLREIFLSDFFKEMDKYIVLFQKAFDLEIQKNTTETKVNHNDKQAYI